MGHDTNDDAALGLPLGPTDIDGTPVMGDPFDFDLLGATPPINPHDGTKPGPTTPSRTDAASLSGLQARQRACRVVEAAAFDALLASLTTQEQFTLVRAYNDSIYATRKAELDVHFALWANGGAA